FLRHRAFDISTHTGQIANEGRAAALESIVVHVGVLVVMREKFTRARDALSSGRQPMEADMARKEALPAKINVIEVLDSDRDDEAVIRIAFQHGELVLR